MISFALQRNINFYVVKHVYFFSLISLGFLSCLRRPPHPQGYTNITSYFLLFISLFFLFTFICKAPYSRHHMGHIWIFWTGRRESLKNSLEKINWSHFCLQTFPIWLRKQYIQLKIISPAASLAFDILLAGS